MNEEEIRAERDVLWRYADEQRQRAERAEAELAHAREGNRNGQRAMDERDATIAELRKADTRVRELAITWINVTAYGGMMASLPERGREVIAALDGTDLEATE